jgi:glycosyltransferase involved in cell wall biosynthesis
MISIITPVYNTGPLLKQTIKSVLDQNGYNNKLPPDYELIVIDDNSDDEETLKILETLPNLSNRIRVLKNQQKKGVSGARNTGIANAKGNWLAFLDSDDLLIEDSLAYRWDYIQKNQDCRWLATPFYLLKAKTLEKKPFSETSPSLYKIIYNEIDQGNAAILKHPVKVLCGQVIWLYVKYSG